LRVHRLFIVAAASALLLPETRGGASAKEAKEVFLHYGTCDASAAIALTERAFVVANDEDSRLRVYLKDESGSAIWSLDLSRFLEVDRAYPETDIEGAARVDNVIYWITSHGRNKAGEWRESRRRFFATAIEGEGTDVRLKPVGRPYRKLLEDLASHRGLEDLKLVDAMGRAPKEEGALNIEGLAAGMEGTLWIGFRNPIPEGRAVLVRLLNPAEVIEGEAARLGEVVRLELAGRGIREMTWSGHDYVIVAGSFDGKGRSRIYRWPGPGMAPRRLREIDLKDFNAEAVVFYPGSGGEDFYLLSDDSSRQVGGVPCKELGSPGARSFRSMRVNLGRD
jgi:hypothetical protein